MNRCDSATTFRQRRAGKGLLSSLVALFTLFAVGSTVLSAQVTLTHTGPTPPGGPFIPGQVCFGQVPQFQASTPAQNDITYAAAGMAYNAVGQNAGGANGGVINLLPNLGDDEVYQIPVGQIQQAGGGNFIFPFFGKDHNLTNEGLWVGTNGFIRFSDGNPNNNVAVEFGQTGILAQNIPAAGGPNEAIYFLNIDLAPQQPGIGADQVWAQVQDGILIITFQDVSQYNPNQVYPYNPVDVQVKIWSTATGTPGRIEVHLGDWPDPAVNPARNHTIGVENLCGTIATAANANHNNANWAAANGAGEVGPDAWEFVPVVGGAMDFRVRLVGVGNNGILETFSPSGALGGDDFWQSSAVSGWVATGTPINVNANNTVTTGPSGQQRVYYVLAEYENCATANAGPVPVTFIANPTPSITPNSGNYCATGANVLFQTANVAGNTYAWSMPLGGGTVTPVVGAPYQANVQWDNAVATNGGNTRSVVVTETSPAGCQGTSTATLTVYRQPANNAVVAGPGVGGALGALGNPCAGTAQVYSVPAGTASTYSWSAVNGVVTAGQGTNSVTITWNANVNNANNTVTVNYSNGPGSLCAASTSANVAVNGVPTAVTPSGLTPVCEGVTTSYTVPFTLGGNFNWALPAGGGIINSVASGPTFSTASVTWTTAGARSITVQQVTPGGCVTNHLTLSVQVNPLPTPAITGATSACTFYNNGTSFLGQALNEYGYTTTNVVGNSYSWVGTPGVTFVGATNTNSVLVRYTTSGAKTITVTETVIATGCTAQNQINVTVNQSPGTKTVTGPGITTANPCAGSGPHVYNLTSYNAANTYVITVPAGGTMGPVALPNFTVNTWGGGPTGTIRVVETSAAGCSSLQDFNVNINPIPDGVITGPNNTCAGNPWTAGGSSAFTFSAVPGTLVSPVYAWSADPAFTPHIASTSGAATANYQINWNTVSPTNCVTANITLQVTNAGAGATCTQTFTHSFTLKPRPSWSSSGNYIDVCAGQTLNLFITPSFAQPACATSRTYTLNILNAPAGTPVVSFSNNTGVFNGVQLGSVAVGTGGTPTFQYNIIDNYPSGSCEMIAGGFNMWTITVNALPLRPTVTSNPPEPYCLSMAPLPTLTIPAPEANVTYVWDPVGTLNFGAGAGAAVGPTNTVTVTAFAGAGSNSYDIIATNGVTGCSKTFNYTFNVAANPTPVIDDVVNGNKCKNYSSSTALWNPAQSDYEYVLTSPATATWGYNWTVTNGTIVGYSNGGVLVGGNGNATEYGTTVNTIHAAGVTPRVWVRWLTGAVGTVKVSEIHPAGCSGTTPDLIQNLTPLDLATVTSLGPVCFSNTNPVTNTAVTLQINNTTAGTVYRVEASSSGAPGTWDNTPAVSVVGNGANVQVAVSTGTNPATNLITSPGTWYFRVLADAGCDNYLPVISEVVYPNPVQLPVSVVDDILCEGDTVLVNVGPTVEWLTTYTLQRRQLTPSLTGYANVAGPGASVSTGVFPPATIELIDASAPIGGIPPTPFTYDYQVVATNFWGCTTWMNATPDIQVFKPCPIAFLPENAANKVNKTQACVYNGFEEHLVTYKLNSAIACMSLGTLSWNVYGLDPNVSGAIRQVGPDSIVVEWYTTGGSGMGQVSATLTMPAIYGGCVTTVTYNTMVFPIPQPVISTGPAEVCAFTQNVEYSATLQPADNYFWTVVGGTIVGGTGAGTNASPSKRNAVNLDKILINWLGANPAATITLRQVSPAGCLNETTRTIKVNPNPTPVISGPSTVCRNRNYTFFTQNNAPNNIYAWTISGNTSGANFVGAAAGASVNVYSGTATGSFQLNVTETTIATGCTGTTSLAVTVVNEPTPVIARTSPLPGQTGAACLGIAHTYTTGTSGNNYLWSVLGGTINAGQGTNTVTVTWNTVGMGTLTVSEWVTNSACTTTVSQPVNVVPKPTPAISGASVACILTPEHTYSTPYVPGNTYNWVITSGTITPCFAPIAGWASANEITIKWIQPGLHTISVTETNPVAGCSETATRQVQVNLSPEPVILTSDDGFGTGREGGVGVVCNNSTHRYFTAATPGNTWVWSVVNGTIQNDDGVNGQYRASIRVKWSTASGGSVSVTETVPGSACTKTVKDSVWIRPTPSPVITGTAPQSNMNAANPCLGSVHTYSAPLVSTTTPPVSSWNSYRWNVVGGTILPDDGVSGQGRNSIKVQWNTLGGGSVNVIEWVTKSGPYANQTLPPAATWNVSDCFNTATYNVTVHPNPQPPVISASQNPVCATDLNDTPQTINTVRYTSNTPAPSGYTYTYTWSVSSNGTIVGQASSNALFNNFIDVQWTNTGTTQTFGQVTLTHTSQWGCATSNTFTATINPIPNPVIVGDREVCAGEVDNYTTTGVPGNSYQWDLVDANGNLSGGNIIRGGQGTPNVTVEWTVPGMNYLQVRETIIATGCSVVYRDTIIVNQLPTAVITPSGATTFCQGGDVTLSAPIGFANYQWNTGETSRNIVVNRTGSFWVIVTDANGCTGSSDTITVNVFPTQLPIITQDGPLTFCEGGSVTLTAPDNFAAYLWSTGDTTQSIVVTQTGSYSVTVSDNQGCTGTSTEVDVMVYAKPDPILSVNGSTTICDGDSVEIIAPLGYVSYTWYSTVSQTVIGTSRSIVLTSSDTVYCEVVSTEGCVGQSDTVGVELQTIVQPVVTANGPTTFCDGNTVTLTAPEGYATYLWSNGATTREITVDRTGEYTVVVSNSARCEIASTKLNVQVNPLPARPSISRTGDTLKAVSAVAQAYQWYRNGNALAGATEQALVVALPGTYRVEIADNNTCSAMSQPFDVVLTDVDEPVAGVSSEVNIFPNPTNGVFTLEADFASAGAVRIELFNLVGDKVLSLNEMSTGGQFRSTVDMGTLATGVYNVVVTTGNERWTLRLVRQ